MTHNVISFDSVSQIKDFVSDVENHNIQVRYGKYELKDNSGQLLESGSMNGNARIGQWTQYYYDQNVKIYITYQSGVQSSEEYKTMEGIPYSGKFEYIDEKNT